MRGAALLFLSLVGAACSRAPAKPRGDDAPAASSLPSVVAAPLSHASASSSASIPDGPAAPARATVAPTLSSRMAPVPTGKVKQLSVGNGHACAITSDDAIVCWSEPNAIFPLGTVPKGRFARVEVGTWSTCAETLAGDLVCFGGRRVLDAAPPGPVADWCHDLGPCVERRDGTATCHLRDEPPKPLGRIRPGSLACGTSYACALTLAGELTCVEMDRVMARGGEDVSSANWHPPPGPFKRVFSGYQHGCALRPDDSVACWGRDTSGETRPPSGRFSTLALGEKLSCGLRPDGDIACWGNGGLGPGVGGPWKGPFKAVGTSTHHDRGNTVCAIKNDDTLQCWPYER